MFTFILQVSVEDEERGSGGAGGGVGRRRKQCFHYVSHVPQDTFVFY